MCIDESFVSKKEGLCLKYAILLNYGVNKKTPRETFSRENIELFENSFWESKS